MKDKKYCKVVQDLLPNYIENLTNEETNQFIEEHLKECSECNQIYENMKKKFSNEKENTETKNVNYLKKFNKKLSLLKIIILVIVILFVGNTARKMTILSDISNKAENAINTENYHRIVYSYDKDNTAVTEIFGMNDKRKIIMRNIKSKEDTILTVTRYATKIEDDEWGNARYNTNIYTEVNGDSKKAELNKNMGISTNPENLFHVDNIWQLFLMAVTSSINTTTYDGEECYHISSSSQIVPNFISNSIYVSKNTGLVISAMGYEIKYEDGDPGRWPAADYVYEFNTVTDEDFIEPDISEYEIVENN